MILTEWETGTTNMKGSNSSIAPASPFSPIKIPERDPF